MKNKVSVLDTFLSFFRRGGSLFRREGGSIVRREGGSLFRREGGSLFGREGGLFFTVLHFPIIKFANILQSETKKCILLYFMGQFKFLSSSSYVKVIIFIFFITLDLYNCILLRSIILDCRRSGSTKTGVREFLHQSPSHERKIPSANENIVSQFCLNLEEIYILLQFI